MTNESVTFGTDVTEDFETIAMAERLPDGTLHFTTVILDKRS